MLPVLTLILAAIAVEARVNPGGPTVVQDFANCVSNLIELNFKQPGVLIFANSDYYSTSVSKIQSKVLKSINGMLNYAVEIMNPEDEDVNVCDNYDEKLSIFHINSFETQPLPAYFVIVIDSYEDFPLLAGRFLRSRSWNPSAKFIILLFHFDTEATNIRFVERILTCLFKYNVTDIIVIVPQVKNIRYALVYGWKAIDPPKYCGYCNETAKNRLYVQNVCEKGSLKFENRVFNMGIPEDMKGCTLTIIALERQPFVSSSRRDSNIEKILINQIAKSYNFKPNYDIVNMFRGERESSGAWDGALKLLTSKKGQVLLGGIYPDFKVHEDFECSSPYLSDSYTWVVPRAHQSPPWVSLSIIFKREVWYSVIASFIVTALSWRCLGKFSKDTIYNESLDHNFMNTWISFLGFSCYIRPTRQSLRIFFSFFNIYCILVITAYQTKLIDVLKNPRFDDQIKNVEQLVASGLKFGGLHNLHELFLNSTDLYDRILFERWEHIEDISQAMLDVAVHRNFSLFCSRLELAHMSAVMPELSDDFGNYRYYAFEMNMFSVPVETVALRGFAFMKMFTERIGLFQQMGVNAALRRRFATFNGRRRATLLREILKEKPEVNSLSLQHLQAGFLILALGYVCGFFVFVLEIIVSTTFLKNKLDYYLNKLIK